MKNAVVRVKNGVAAAWSAVRNRTLAALSRLRRLLRSVVSTLLTIVTGGHSPSRHRNNILVFLTLCVFAAGGTFFTIDSTYTRIKNYFYPPPPVTVATPNAVPLVQDLPIFNTTVQEIEENHRYGAIFQVEPDPFDRQTTRIILTTRGDGMGTGSGSAEGVTYAIYASDDGQNWGRLQSRTDYTAASLDYVELAGITPEYVYICIATPIPSDTPLYFVLEETYRRVDRRSRFDLAARPGKSLHPDDTRCLEKSLAVYTPKLDPADLPSTLLQQVVPDDLSGSLNAAMSTQVRGGGLSVAGATLGGDFDRTVAAILEVHGDWRAYHGTSSTSQGRVAALVAPGDTAGMLLVERKGTNRLAAIAVITNSFPRALDYFDAQDRLTRTLGEPVVTDSFGGGSKASAWVGGGNPDCVGMPNRITLNFPPESRPPNLFRELFARSNRGYGQRPPDCITFVNFYALDSPHINLYQLTLGDLRYIAR